MLMSDIESLEDTFEHKTRDIVQEMRNKFNERNVGGYLHKAGCVLDEIKSNQLILPFKTSDFFWGNLIVIMMEMWSL